MQRSEHKLIEGVKRRDKEAQRALYDTYANRLMAISMRYLSRRDVAEDSLQDSFVKIFRSIDKFTYRGEGSLRAWMERISINTALEHLRNGKKSMLLDENYIPDNLASEPSYSDVESLPQELLMNLIGELPDGYRAVFNLYCIEGYSHKEIAEQLGINEKSSSSQLLRAKRLLASKVKQYI